LLQSNVIGWATIAPFAGLRRLGADGAGAAAGSTTNVTVRDVPPNEAVIVTDVDALTALVVTVKFALLLPAGTVTLAGTAAALELSDRVTTAPPSTAGALKLTVPVTDVPPETDV
jgi:hypothetical protein